MSGSRRRNGKVSEYAVSSSISGSLKGLLDSQHEITVGIKEPASAVPNHSGPYRTHLFRRGGKPHSVNLFVGVLLEVVGVRADP
jgi:hypothetical protein